MSRVKLSNGQWAAQVLLCEVEDKENLLLDSKEKIEFYRTKMQDLVLYKSRCDNRLNEIIERALAYKREAELLGKTYEEKYKQVAEVASKLTIEEAALREIQERKMELHQAIIKMEQGGSTDGILQVHGDRIQSDLEELMKALTERCKKHGIDIKFLSVIELPIGPSGDHSGRPSALLELSKLVQCFSFFYLDWSCIRDLLFWNDHFWVGNLESQRYHLFGMKIGINSKMKDFHLMLLCHSKPNPQQLREKMILQIIVYPPTHCFTLMVCQRNLSVMGGHAFDEESAYSHCEDVLGKSASGSPVGGHTPFKSPYREYSDNHFIKSPKADVESNSFDEPTLGTFDNNYDADSMWGFNPGNTKDLDHEKHFFGSSDFGASPRTESPQASDIFQNKSIFGFDDSVPSTPLSRA